jgi:hypothetical protein
MPLTLIVETGAIVPNANTYIGLTDANAYFEGRAHSEEWEAANPDEKEVALVNATRSIDQMMDYYGWRVNKTTQSLGWPRVWVNDPEGWQLYGSTFYPSNAIPQKLKEAVCEMALVILNDDDDRSADDPAKGVSSVSVGQGAVAVDFNSSDRRRIIPDNVRLLLRTFGRVVGVGSGNAKTYRDEPHVWP